MSDAWKAEETLMPGTHGADLPGQQILFNNLRLSWVGKQRASHDSMPSVTLVLWLMHRAACSSELAPHFQGSSDIMLRELKYVARLQVA